MAITNITDLTEIQASSLTDNDLIAVGTSSGWKKIKANSLGGGGGAEDFVVDFSIDMPNVTSETTFAQISSAYQQGKNIKGVGTITGIGDVIFQLSQISDSVAVFLGFVEQSAGEGVDVTIRGTSSGYSMYLYQ